MENEGLAGMGTDFTLTLLVCADSVIDGKESADFIGGRVSMGEIEVAVGVALISELTELELSPSFVGSSLMVTKPDKDCWVRDIMSA